MAMIGRREFLLGTIAFSAGWLGATALPYINDSASRPPSQRIVFLPEQLQHLALNLKGLGSLDKIPPGNSDRLEDELLRRINQDELSDVANLDRRILRLIEQDFLNRRTVFIEDWMFADTEVKLLSYKKQLHAKTGRAYVAKSEKTSFDTARTATFLKIKKWGPKETCIGAPFNKQAGGHSANWFEIEDYSGPLNIYFGQHKIKTRFRGLAATTRIDGKLFDELTKEVAEHDVFMYNPHRNIKQKVGVFVVKSTEGRTTTTTGQTSKVFGEIVRWGPRRTRRLTAFNVQKDGASSIGISTSCSPADTRVLFGGVELSAEVRNGGIIAKLDDLSLLKQIGSKELVLDSKSADERILVGQFEITE